MADLMADDSQPLVVAHYIHQRGEDPDAAVGAGEGVDIDHIIHLEIQGYAVNLCEAFGEAAQTLGVGVILSGDGIVLVHPVDRLFYISGHLLVGERQGLHTLLGSVESLAELELGLGLLTAKNGSQSEGKRKENLLHCIIAIDK